MFYMKVVKVDRIKNLSSFKGATININALSDTHGHIELSDKAFEAMASCKDDIFIKNDGKKSAANYFIVGGDWFISADIKGFLTSPKTPLGDFQTKMLNKMTDCIKTLCPSVKPIFVTGNHDLDCGGDVFHDFAKNMNSKIIVTNLDFENSPSVKDLIDEDKIVKSQIDFIQDDKDKNKTHPVLNLGVAPVNLSYYVADSGVKMVEDKKIPQKFVAQEHFKKTFDEVQTQVQNFKEQYPDGKVILTCHTGANFADYCANNYLADIIFDGHEHKDEVRFVNNIPIIGLSQNFKKIVNAKLSLDDDGKLKEIKIQNIKPKEKPEKSGELDKYYKELFMEDSKNIFNIQCEGIEKLDIEGIRSKNNHLANFLCDSLLSEIKEYDPSVQIFALCASAMRGNFRVSKQPSISMFDVMSALNGISKKQSRVFVSEVKGSELATMIGDNFLFNSIDTEKNPIIHYSGIKVNKTEFVKGALMGQKEDELCKYITFEETNEPVDPDKTYKIANPEKYFIKTTNPKIKGIYQKSYPLDINIRDLLPQYFMKHNSIKTETKERFY